MIEYEVEHSFVIGGGSESSSKEVGMAPKPRNLGTTVFQKMAKAAIDPLEVQVPPFVQDPILTLPDPTKAKSRLSPSLLKKCMEK